MIRIRTKIGEGRVLTLYFMGKWITIMSGIGRTKSTDSPDFLGAGENHLAYCQHLKEMYDAQRRRFDSELLSRTGHHGSDSARVSEGNGRIDREGADGSSGSGGAEVLPPDSSSSENEESLPVQSEGSELSYGT